MTDGQEKTQNAPDIRDENRAVTTRKNKILVVDDAVSIRTLIKSVLEKEYAVETASSGEEALDVIPRFAPDLVLLDVVMGEMDGYEVCRRLRASGNLHLIKVVMVSSKSMVEERLHGYDAGADDYLVKPFDKEELLAKVRVFMRLKNVEDRLRELNAELNEQVRLRTEQLLDAERLAAIGRYAAGIVHNLNSPLQIIMGNAEILTMKHPDNRNIMNMRKAAAQMKKIVASILGAGVRESRADYVPVDLNEVIRDKAEFLKSNLFFKHKIRTDMDLNPLPPLHGVYHHFSQSIGNIIHNALDAMHNQNQGVLSISTGVEGDAVVIRIMDNGDGIPPELIDKIYDPFFTTKPLTSEDNRPAGTGLGLASGREMIASYGGKIEVKSEVGKGTTFTVTFPLPPSP